MCGWQLPPLVTGARVAFCPVYNMLVQSCEFVAVAPGLDGRVYIYNMCHPGEPPLVQLHEHAAPISAVDWSPTGAVMVSADTDGGLVFWRRATRQD
eukprot:9025253-Pyramimonas_sp.AAC.1